MANGDVPGATHERHMQASQKSSAASSSASQPDREKGFPSMDSDSTMANPNGEVLIEGRGLEKGFPGVLALDQVDFCVKRGEVHVLLGENGAGKSTLVKVFSGVYQLDRGQLVVGGEMVKEWNARLALQAGVSTIYQEFNLAPDMTVMENVFMGREPQGRLSFLRNRRALKARTEDLLERFGFILDPEATVRSLGVAQRQMTEILKSLSLADERVIIFDEPTAALSDREIDNLFSIIGRLKESGVGMLYVTHRLDEVPLIGDQVTVMRDGRIVGSGHPAMVDRSTVIEWMVGHKLKDYNHGAGHVRREVALSVRDFSVGPRVHAVSFDVHQGEVVALFGLVGAGRTELVRAIVGVDKPDTGSVVSVKARPVVLSSPEKALRLGVGLSPEDRKRSGIVPDRSVRENVVLASLNKLTRWGPVLDRSRVNERAAGFVARLRIRAPSLDTLAGSLSGGNQQKVILARLLAAEIGVLILDEPTRGIDVGARQEVYEIIDELASSGVGVLVATSDLDEVMRIADRIVVMSEGRVTGERTAAEADRTELMHLAFPTNEQRSVTDSDKSGGEAPAGDVGLLEV